MIVAFESAHAACKDDAIRHVAALPYMRFRRHECCTCLSLGSWMERGDYRGITTMDHVPE